MTPRVTAILVSFVIILLGAAGLLYPERVLGVVGFAVQNPSHAAAALGEGRATYGGAAVQDPAPRGAGPGGGRGAFGGLFLVMGLAALLGAFDPVAHRGRLRLI